MSLGFVCVGYDTIDASASLFPQQPAESITLCSMLAPAQTSFISLRSEQHLKPPQVVGTEHNRFLWGRGWKHVSFVCIQVRLAMASVTIASSNAHVQRRVHPWTWSFATKDRNYVGRTELSLQLKGFAFQPWSKPLVRSRIIHTLLVNIFIAVYRGQTRDLFLPLWCHTKAHLHWEWIGDDEKGDGDTGQDISWNIRLVHK